MSDDKLEHIIRLCTEIADEQVRQKAALIIIQEQLRVDDEPEHIGLRVKRIEQALSGMNEQVKSIYEHTIGTVDGRKSIHDLQSEEKRRATGGHATER